MKFLGVLLLLVFPTFAQFGPTTASRILRGSGSPSSGLCQVAGDVGKVYIQLNAASTNTPLSICANTGSGTYGWVLSGAGAGPVIPTGLVYGNGSTLSGLNGATGCLPYFSSTGVPGCDATNLAYDGTSHILTVLNVAGTNSDALNLFNFGSPQSTFSAGVQSTFLNNLNQANFNYHGTSNTLLNTISIVQETTDAGEIALQVAGLTSGTGSSGPTGIETFAGVSGSGAITVSFAHAISGVSYVETGNTVTSFEAFETDTAGAGGTIVNYWGLGCRHGFGATTQNYCVYSTQDAGTGNYVVYGSGTAPSHFGGVVDVTGGIIATGVAFASLPSPTNGQFIYCTDCTVTSGINNTCVASGSGAFAERVNGAWKCYQ